MPHISACEIDGEQDHNAPAKADMTTDQNSEEVWMPSPVPPGPPPIVIND